MWSNAEKREDSLKQKSFVLIHHEPCLNSEQISLCSFIFMNFVCHLHNLKGKCFWFTQNEDVKSNTNRPPFILSCLPHLVVCLGWVLHTGKEKNFTVIKKDKVKCSYLKLESQNWQKTVTGNHQKFRSFPFQFPSFHPTRCQRRGQKSVQSVSRCLSIYVILHERSASSSWALFISVCNPMMVSDSLVGVRKFPQVADL